MTNFDEIKNLVAKAQENEKKLEGKKLEKEEKEKQEIIEELQTWMPKIQNWLKVCNYLAEQGYALGSPLHAERWNVPKEQKMMCTDGVHHNFGLWGADLFKAYKHFNYMGIAQGGCCGDYHIFTDGFSWWTKKGGECYEMRLCDYVELIFKYRDKNRLERFEDNFNALIAMIERKANKTA